MKNFSIKYFSAAFRWISKTNRIFLSDGFIVEKVQLCEIFLDSLLVLLEGNSKLWFKLNLFSAKVCACWIPERLLIWNFWAVLKYVNLQLNRKQSWSTLGGWKQFKSFDLIHTKWKILAVKPSNSTCWIQLWPLTSSPFRMTYLFAVTEQLLSVCFFLSSSGVPVTILWRHNQTSSVLIGSSVFSYSHQQTWELLIWRSRNSMTQLLQIKNLCSSHHTPPPPSPFCHVTVAVFAWCLSAPRGRSASQTLAGMQNGTGNVSRVGSGALLTSSVKMASLPLSNMSSSSSLVVVLPAAEREHRATQLESHSIAARKRRIRKRSWQKMRFC